MNTGLRIDLAQIPSLHKMKFNIDLIFNDLFDDTKSWSGGRSFTVAAMFGLSALDAKK